MLKAYVCVIVLVLLWAPPVTPGDTPDGKAPGKAPPATADAVAEERAKNDEAYQSYLRMKDALHRDHAGEWVGIVGGKLLPVDKESKLAPSKQAKECLAALEKAAPSAKHRYLWSIGEEGETTYFIGGAFFGAESPRNLVGLGLLRRVEMSASLDSATMILTLERGEKQCDFQPDESNRPTIEFTLEAPDKTKQIRSKGGFSSVCGAFVLLDTKTAQAVDTARFEIPGIAKISSVMGEELRARRAYAIMSIPELEIEELVPVGIFVQE